MTEPTRETVLAWLAERSNRTAEDAVDRWWPTAPDRSRVLARVRQWVSRARRRTAGAEASPATASVAGAKVVEGPPRPEADYERAKLERALFLEWQLAELIADLTWVRQSGMVGRIAPLDARVAEVRLQLDQARDAAGSNIEEDATAEDIAAEIMRRQKLINELTEARDRRERQL